MDGGVIIAQCGWHAARRIQLWFSDIYDDNVCWVDGSWNRLAYSLQKRLWRILWNSDISRLLIACKKWPKLMIIWHASWIIIIITYRLFSKTIFLRFIKRKVSSQEKTNQNCYYKNNIIIIERRLSEPIGEEIYLNNRMK